MTPPSGLVNGGNTCFCNSILQILAHVPFGNIEPSVKDVGESKLSQAWLSLHLSLRRATSRVIDPSVFLSVLFQTTTHFRRGEQADASEFLCFLLDYLHESAVRFEVNNNASEKHVFGVTQKQYCSEFTYIRDLFHGILGHTLTNKSTDKIISTPAQLSGSMSLSTNGGDNLSECVSSFIAPEEMTGILDESTGELCDVIKRSFLYYLPKVLILDLKRFSADGQKKCNKFIRYPVTEFQLGNRKYYLFGLCCHIGSIHSGHYISAILRDGKWWMCDDDTVREIPFSRVQSLPVYILFYAIYP